MDLQRWVAEAVAAVERWQDSYGPADRHGSLEVDDARFATAYGAFVERLGDNYPFFHPRYAGQMLKPPHPAAVVGYLTAMLINPNNHALDGGPATAAMEKEVVADLARMFGYGAHLGHLTSSGTIANLEALYVARESHPGRGVAYSSEAHYTHGRMCGVLGVRGQSVSVDTAGRMDLMHLEQLLQTGDIGTVVATTGTTGLGAVDPVHEIVALAAQYDARVHVDAAYGGFFTLLAGREGIEAAPWQAISRADSVVVDPHKHGLQPYGCGAVVFRDPSVARFYLHDSPYTYFTSDELHLGEISLECSRAGAAAAALWLTLQLLPLTHDGLGAVLAAGRRAALAWDRAVADSDVLTTYQPAQLDIVTYYPSRTTLAEVDATAAHVLDAGMAADDPVFLSTLRVGADAFAARHPAAAVDADGARVLRSVLMKPESESAVPALLDRVEALARTV